MPAKSSQLWHKELMPIRPSPKEKEHRKSALELYEKLTGRSSSPPTFTPRDQTHALQTASQDALDAWIYRSKFPVYPVSGEISLPGPRTFRGLTFYRSLIRPLNRKLVFDRCHFQNTRILFPEGNGVLSFQHCTGEHLDVGAVDTLRVVQSTIEEFEALDVRGTLRIQGSSLPRASIEKATLVDEESLLEHSSLEGALLMNISAERPLRIHACQVAGAKISAINAVIQLTESKGELACLIQAGKSATP